MEAKNVLPENLQPESSSLSAEGLRTIIEEEGLIYVGLVNLGVEPRFVDFAHWLSENKHAELTYLERYRDLREDSSKILAGAKQAIILAYPYFQGDRYDFRKDTRPRAAQYSRISDYHKVLKKKCESILEKVLKHLPEAHYGRVFVDSAPLLERALAERVGEGFIGKNTMFIHPEWGSYVLLSQIFISAYLFAPETFTKATKSCGTCMRCQVYCPTGALSPYSLDARKCIAYYTIEHRGTIPVLFWKHLGTYFFGCDICQQVCPFNRKIPLAKHLTVKIPELPPLPEIARMSQAYYEQVFGGTPMTRAKRVGLRRNALIAMIVLKDPDLEETVAYIQEEGEDLLLKTLEQIPEYEING